MRSHDLQTSKARDQRQELQLVIVGKADRVAARAHKQKVVKCWQLQSHAGGKSTQQLGF